MPAGSFVACKFTEEFSETGKGINWCTPYESKTRWLAQGTGIEEKFTGVYDGKTATLELVHLDDVATTHYVLEIPQAPQSETTPTVAALLCKPPRGTQYRGRYNLSGFRNATEGVRSFAYDQTVTVDALTLFQRSEEWQFGHTSPSPFSRQAATRRFIQNYETEFSRIYSDQETESWTFWDQPDRLFGLDTKYVHDRLYIDQRFQLLPGQSTETVVTSAKTGTYWWRPGESLGPDKSERLLRVTFHGLETVTVPAGSFTACKFTEEEFYGDSSYFWLYDTKTRWLAQETGVEVKFKGKFFSDDEFPSTMELISLE